MARAIRFHQTGGPEVLVLETAQLGEPGPGQARVRHTYVAVNFIDIYFRTGRYPLPLPRAHMLEMAKELFDLVLAGKIRSGPNQIFALEDAAEAHRALEARKTVGATVLVP